MFFSRSSVDKLVPQPVATQPLICGTTISLWIGQIITAVSRRSLSQPGYVRTFLYSTAKFCFIFTPKFPTVIEGRSVSSIWPFPTSLISTTFQLIYLITLIRFLWGRKSKADSMLMTMKKTCMQKQTLSYREQRCKRSLYNPLKP